MSKAIVMPPNGAGGGMRLEKLWEGDITVSTGSNDLTDGALTAADVAGYDALVLWCEGTMTASSSDMYVRLGGGASSSIYDARIRSSHGATSIRVCKLLTSVSPDGTSWLMLSANVGSNGGRDSEGLIFGVNAYGTGTLHVKVIGVKF